MSHLIDILSGIVEGVFQLKPPFSVIAQEINKVNGGLVLKSKLLCVEIGNNTHIRICTRENPFTFAKNGITPMFTKVKFLLMSLLHKHLFFMNFIKSVKLILNYIVTVCTKPS